MTDLADCLNSIRSTTAPSIRTSNMSSPGYGRSPARIPVDGSAFRVALPIPLQLPAAGGGNGDLSYTVSPIPPGLSFDPATRVVSGMPAADKDDDVATFTVTVIHSMVFWTDLRTRTIWSANLDGSGAKVPRSF